MTASFHSKVGTFTPLMLNNYHVRIAKLIGFGRGSWVGVAVGVGRAPRAQTSIPLYPVK